MSDPNKPDMSLVPLKTLEAVARVFKDGLKKEGRVANDWQKSDPILFLSALIRHLGEHQYGNLIDPESGESHLAHAATNAIILLWHQQNGGSNEQGSSNKDAEGESGCRHSGGSYVWYSVWYCKSCGKPI